MSNVKNRTLAVNLPRGDVGQRVETALNIMMEEEDRSMSKTILRILIKAIASREPEFHAEVMERFDEFDRGGDDGEV